MGVVFFFLLITLLGTNISPLQGTFESIIFLFPRCDMLVPWRVRFLYLWMHFTSPLAAPACAYRIVVFFFANFRVAESRVEIRLAISPHFPKHYTPMARTGCWDFFGPYFLSFFFPDLKSQDSWYIKEILGG